jgi:hypothetical protein
MYNECALDPSNNAFAEFGCVYQGLDDGGIQGFPRYFESGRIVEGI